MLAMCLTLLYANISSNMTFTPIEIAGHISSGLMELFTMISS